MHTITREILELKTIIDTKLTRWAKEQVSRWNSNSNLDLKFALIKLLKMQAENITDLKYKREVKQYGG